MKIGLVIYGSLDQQTGGYHYDRRLVEELVARGNEVAVCSLPGRSYVRHLGDNLTSRVRRWLEAEAPEVLLQDELNHPSLAFSNTHLRRTGVLLGSIVHHLRSDEAWGPLAGLLYRSVERHYLRSLDALICNSRPTLAAALALASRRLEAIVAWPGADARPSISAERIRARAHDPGPLRVVYLGAIIPRKGLDVLLRALTRLAPASVRLSVIGNDQVDRAYADRCRGLSCRLHGAHAVEWHGPASEAEVAQVLATSHVIAIPSQYEGFGIAYLEGMAHGLVPLASLAGGATDLIEDGRTGYLIDPGDVDAVTSRLKQLHKDRHRLAAMGCAATDRYRAHPSWRQIAQQVSDFLAGLVHARSAPMVDPRTTHLKAGG